jgi:hypothetical protein
MNSLVNKNKITINGKVHSCYYLSGVTRYGNLMICFLDRKKSGLPYKITVTVHVVKEWQQ